MAKYAVLVPCYNVGKACIPVLKSAAGRADVCIAIDDGSTDDTEASMKNTGAQIKIVKHEKNLGKGAALISGFRTVLSSYPEIDAVITLDGDGQHDPSLITAFKEAYERTGADLVYGNRMADTSQMPAHRRWLNNLSNRTISKLCGQTIQDSQCGFRLYKRALLSELMEFLKSDRYELETEILIRACRSKKKLAVVPISTIYSKETNVLSHHSLTDVLRITRLIVHFHRNRT